MLEAVYSGPPSLAQRATVEWLITHCYGGNSERSFRYVEKVGLENHRVVARSDGEVLAGCALFAGGQWFGGRAIPSLGVAAVGVPAEYRGQGSAKTLMIGLLRECHQKKIPLSSLYPSTQILYRSVGYETAGTAHRWKLNPAHIQSQDRTLPCWRFDPEDRKLTTPLYNRYAATTAGNIDRTELFWWRTLRLSEGETLYAYGFGPKEAPEGYLLYSQSIGSDGLEILVRDRVLLTPSAHRRCWALLSDLRSMVEKVTFAAPGNDPGVALLMEEVAEIAWYRRWMLRIVDVPGAILGRGYSADGVLDLELEDPVIPENSGRWRLEVKNGVPGVERGGSGALKMNIRGLAPLYSGLFTAFQLEAMGWLTTTDPAVLQVASQIFAGPEPFMSDSF